MSDSILNDDSIPPLQPIDIELTDTFPLPEDMPEVMPEELPDEPLAELPDEPLEEIEDEAEPDFEATMVIAPDASLSKKPSGNSTEAFIERVKEQLADSPAKPKDKPFISTVPH